MHNTLEEEAFAEGMKLFTAIKNSPESMFNKQYWMGLMMEWVMKDPNFKVDLFRFVDVLPALSTNEQVARHIKEYLIDKHQDIPLIMGTALKAASFGVTRGLAAAAIRKNVTEMAERFILGTDIKSASKNLLRLKEQGYLFTIDLLGEKALSDRECDDYAARYEEIITALPHIVSSSIDPPNVSIKVSALAVNLKEEALNYSVEEAKKRVLPLLRLAKTHGVFVNFDLESFATHEIVMALFSEIVTSAEFSSWPHLGIVVQAYLKDSPRHLQNLLEASKKRSAPLTVRLVKGAYWDYEVLMAKKLGFSCPVFEDKAQTDLNYEALSRFLIDNIKMLKPAFASHNIRSLAQAIAYAKHKKVEPSRYEIQMLYGMADTERKVLKEEGHLVRLYLPIGEMIPGMSYLVRRLLENTSQMGFIKLSQHDKVHEHALLKAPVLGAVSSKKELKNFINEPLLDFTKKDIRDRFAKSIDEVAKLLPLAVPVMIQGLPQRPAAKIERLSPNDRTKIADVALADLNQADRAVACSLAVFADFRASPLSVRQGHLLKLAAILEEDLFYLSALICHEVGKTWSESAADVAEAIDFCRYYALRAGVELTAKKLQEVGGEDNTLLYQGRGPTVIIAPWNFPLAILCGMSVAAYVAGNPIIMKPAEQSSLTAFSLYERMMRAGFEAQACHFLPGLGEEVGAHLVHHPNVANICFTGSLAVGQEIIKAANTVVPEQIQMKRVLCEMGGKNAIIIDDDADLDEAVLHIIKSAFVYAGQKCSAASRLILVGAIKDHAITRLIEATKSISVGSSLNPSTFMGPVIDQEAYDRLLQVIKKIRLDSSVTTLYVGPELEGGFFVPPTIVLVPDAHHWLMQEEFFGPIIAIHTTDDFDAALSVVNGVKYALTGAVFSRSPQNIIKAKERFLVGNLYINQKCTGAQVERQPFGGFKMSGTGIKAGGPHYLLNFVDARAISENTMRRGFAPEEGS